mgnify:CR=1 FL=1
MLELDRIYNGDCLDVMQDIDKKSVSLILCDLPYNTTPCKWDCMIPFEPLWNAYKRIIKPEGAIVLFAQQPFTTKLISSNLERLLFHLCDENFLRDAQRLLSVEFALVLGIAPEQVGEYVVRAMEG